MKGGLVGGRFVLLSISNLNLLNTARMKGRNGYTVAHCGFISLMSRAIRASSSLNAQQCFVYTRINMLTLENLNDTKK